MPGRLSRSLARSLAGRLTRSPAVVDPDAYLTALGSDLHHWWEPRDSETTLNGSNISQIDNLVSGGPALVQATAGNQPALVDDGSGPNNRPYISLHSTSRHLDAVTSISAGHRTGVYLVSLAAVAGASRVQLGLLDTSESDAGQIADLSGGQYRHIGLFTGGAQTHPFGSATTTWRLHSYRPLASGAIHEFDGASVGGWSGSDTFQALTTARIGHTTAAGGGVAALIFTAEPTAAINTAVKNYVAARFGLTLS